MVDRYSTAYTDTWPLFRFGSKKTNCMIVSSDRLSEEPSWNLNGNAISNVEWLEILDVHFYSKGGATARQ